MTTRSHIRSHIPQHSSESVEHYTPEYIVDAARLVMGGFDLDPASCEIANRVVRAKTIFTKEGLRQQWRGRVFLNPPGGRAEIKGMGTDSNAVLWWAALATWYQSGHVKSGFFVGFTLEILSTAQVLIDQGVPQPMDFPFCVSRGRTAFDVPRVDEIRRLEQAIQEKRATGKEPSRSHLKRLEKLRGMTEDRVPSDSPTHANVFVYLPDKGDDRTEIFRAEFSKFGRVR